MNKKKEKNAQHIDPKYLMQFIDKHLSKEKENSIFFFLLFDFASHQTRD